MLCDHQAGLSSSTTWHPRALLSVSRQMCMCSSAAVQESPLSGHATRSHLPCHALPCFACRQAMHRPAWGSCGPPSGYAGPCLSWPWPWPSPPWSCMQQTAVHPTRPSACTQAPWRCALRCSASHGWCAGSPVTTAGALHRPLTYFVTAGLPVAGQSKCRATHNAGCWSTAVSA